LIANTHTFIDLRETGFVLLHCESAASSRFLQVSEDYDLGRWSDRRFPVRSASTELPIL